MVSIMTFNVHALIQWSSDTHSQTYSSKVMVSILICLSYSKQSW